MNRLEVSRIDSVAFGGKERGRKEEEMHTVYGYVSSQSGNGTSFNVVVCELFDGSEAESCEIVELITCE